MVEKARKYNPQITEISTTSELPKSIRKEVVAVSEDPNVKIYAIGKRKSPILVADEESDSVYIKFSGRRVARTHIADDLRMVDLDEKGAIGVELIAGSQASLRGLPLRPVRLRQGEALLSTYKQGRNSK